MLDKILKNQQLNWLFGCTVFFLVAVVFLTAAKQYHASVEIILMLGYFLGLGTAEFEKWLDKKQEELNS